MSKGLISDELFNRMRGLEERGREIAYHRDVPDYVVKAMEWSGELFEFLPEVRKSIEKVEHIEEVRKIIPYITHLRYTSDSLWSDLWLCRYGLKIRRLKDCIIWTDTVKAMRELDKMCKDLTGERCVYLSTERVPSSACVNDLTACFHRLIEQLERTVGAERIEERGDKYVIMRGAGERERELLKVWLDAINKLWKKGFYSPKDWEALSGVALKGKLEVRVGSAYEHRTHVDIEKNVIEYYDDDISVNVEMRDLWEKYAECSCRIHSFGVKCERCDLEKAMKVLAGATSCDIRVKRLKEGEGLSIKQARERDKKEIVTTLGLTRKRRKRVVIRSS